MIKARKHEKMLSGLLFYVRLLLSLNGDFLHYLRCCGLVAVICFALCDLVNYFHALNYLAECCIVSVKVGSIIVHDEEL